jgi:hypothetical protein
MPPSSGCVFCLLLNLVSYRVFFSPVDLVVADIPLPLLGYGGLCFVLLFFFLLVSSKEIQLKKSSLGGGRPPVSSTVWGVAIQLCSSSSSVPTAGGIGRVDRRSSALGPHAPESFCSLTAHEGHTPLFQAVIGGI